MDAYLIHIVILASIFAITVMALDVVVGQTGLMNFGHVGLRGIGAYTSAVLSTLWGFPVWISIIIAVVLTTIISVILALPSKKIKRDYYALVTLGFFFVANAVFTNWESVTRGTLGIPGIPRPEGFATNNTFLWLVHTVLER